MLTNDSDPDGTTPTVSAIETGSSVGGGTAGTVGTVLPGAYGSLTLDADGTYTYVVDANNADVLALGAGDAPTDRDPADIHRHRETLNTYTIH